VSSALKSINVLLGEAVFHNGAIGHQLVVKSWRNNGVENVFAIVNHIQNNLQNSMSALW
jgi:hypothetical protein